MPGKKNSSLDRVLGRIDTLDSVSLANLVQRLARERGLFEDIFNTLQEGVLVISADGRIEYANSSAQRLIGLSDDDLSGQTLWRLVPGLRASLEPSLGGDGDIALPTLLRAMSTKPAELLGLSGGTLRGGAPADVIVIDADMPWVLDPAELKSKCKNTPFDEARLTGRVVRTIVAGRTVYEYV